MPELDLGFLIRPGLPWWIGLAVAVGIGLWAYLRLPAPLGRLERIVLHGLRGAALLLLLLLLLEPVLSLRTADHGRPRLGVLVDRSASMRLPGAQAPSRATAAAVALEDLERRLAPTFDLDLLGFSAGLTPRRPDQAGYAWTPRGATALGDALEEALLRQGDRPWGALLLISDGQTTHGKDPLRVARTCPVPLFGVALGDTQAPADLLVREIQAHPVAHVGEPYGLRVLLQQTRLPEREVTLIVRERGVAGQAVRGGGRELLRHTLLLPGGEAGEIEVPLQIVPARVGLTLFEVEASVPDSERVTLNNRRWVAAEVAERKTRVLYLEGAPDWDFTFLKRTLAADTTLAYAFLVRQADGSFRAYGRQPPDALPATAAELTPFAAVILGHLAPEALPAGFESALHAFLREGGGVLFLAGSSPPTLERWQDGPLGDRLPLRPGVRRRAEPQLVACRPSPAGRVHEITALDESPGASERRWQALPPIWLPARAWAAVPGATVLLTADRSPESEASPVLALGPVLGGRVAALVGRGFWRWEFAMQEAGAGAEMRDFWRRMVRWLSAPAERERITIRPVRPVFQDGEPVAFAGRLHDRESRPVTAARVTVRLQRIPDPAGDSAESPAAEISGGREFLLYPESAGRYFGTVAELLPGAYRYTAHAIAGSGTARRSWETEGAFWVEPMGPEYLTLAGDRRLLNRLAEATGGITVAGDGTDAILDALPRDYRRRHVVRQAELWNHWPVFAFLTALLAVEWVLRRRRGLA